MSTKCDVAHVPAELAGISTKWELITPEVAKQYLETNTNNRQVRSTHVRTLASDMTSGTYHVTHQGIAFHEDGSLCDGQHRLLAVVESEVHVWMLVTRGLPRIAQSAIDDHARRTASDALRLGLGLEIDRHAVAIIRLLVSVDKGFTDLPTRNVIAEVWDLAKDAIAFARPNVSERGTTSATTRAAIAAAWFYERDLDRLAQYDRILTGRQMAAGDKDYAAQLAREALLSGRLSASHGFTKRREVYRKLQRTIQAFMRGQRLSKIMEPSETIYPWPLVDPVRISTGG